MKLGILFVLIFELCQCRSHFLNYLCNSHQIVQSSKKRHEIMNCHKSTRFQIKSKSYLESARALRTGKVPSVPLWL